MELTWCIIEAILLKHFRERFLKNRSRKKKQQTIQHISQKASFSNEIESFSLSFSPGRQSWKPIAQFNFSLFLIE